MTIEEFIESGRKVTITHEQCFYVYGGTYKDSNLNTAWKEHILEGFGSTVESAMEDFKRSIAGLPEKEQW